MPLMLDIQFMTLLETFTMLLVTEHTANDCRLQRCQGNLLKGHRQNN